MVSPMKPTKEKSTKDAKPLIKLPYPFRVANKDMKEKDFEKFVKIFKMLEIHIPFFEALEKIPLYHKFMKEVL